jgi:hypothetical protein
MIAKQKKQKTKDKTLPASDRKGPLKKRRIFKISTLHH